MKVVGHTGTSYQEKLLMPSVEDFKSRCDKSLSNLVK